MIESTRNYLQITRCLHISKLLESAIVTAEKSQMSYLEFLHYLLEKECSEREQRSITRRLKQARLPAMKSFDDFDFAYQQSITKKQVQNWLSFVWIEQRENIILMGPPGVGKTHIAIALCYEAVKAGYKALFHNMNDLIEALTLANLDDKMDIFLNKLSRFDLIVIDEMGYLPLNPVAANLFFRFVSHMYEYKSIVITSNRLFNEWGVTFNDNVIATAILDRLLHHAHAITMLGDSFRIKHLKQ